MRNYRRRLPICAQEENEYKVLFQTACQQLAREINSESEELFVESNEPDLLSEQEIERLEFDPEARELIAHLEKTAQFPHPDLSFRETLRDTLRTQFRNIVTTRQKEEEREYALLETLLEEKTNPVLMDPVYRETLLNALQEKLKNMHIDQPNISRGEEILLDTEQAIKHLSGLCKLNETDAVDSDDRWSGDLPFFVSAD